jgi:hypothetical protein
MKKGTPMAGQFPLMPVRKPQAPKKKVAKGATKSKARKKT